jgi:hypothetical protein
MHDKLTTTSRTRSSEAFDTDAYLNGLGAARTARHASEGGFNSPLPEHVGLAVRNIRTDINGAFQDARQETDPGDEARIPLTQLKAEYWERASRVDVKHGAKPGYDLDKYLTIGPGRTYAEIKERIENEYPEGSVPRSVLDGIDAYHEVLQVNPAHAATITMELIGRHLGDIHNRANILEETGEYEPKDATAKAFSDYITEQVPYHIHTIIEKYGYGDDAVRPVMSKSSFYPLSEHESEGKSLVLAENDAAGLVEVYDIQSRPYDETTLAMGDELAQIPEMQKAMIQVQEDLVEASAGYLKMHPERAAGNLENFSEIFVPEYVNDRMDLLPNPKLLLAMVNNVMPAVATQLLRRGGSAEAVTVDDINEGVHIAAKEFKLFQTKIGQFNKYDPVKGTTELQSTFQVVCPANSLFPNFLTAKLAKHYEEAK